MMKGNIIQLFRRSKPIFEYFLGYPLTILAFLFIGNILYSSRVKIASSLFHTNLFHLTLGILCVSLFFMVKGILWILLLNKNNLVTNRKRLLFSYTFSEIQRYIPGNIFAYLKRIKTHKAENIDTRSVVKNIVIESAILASSAALLSITGVLFLLKNNSFILFNNFFILICLFAALVILVTLYLFITKLNYSIFSKVFFEKHLPLFLLGCLGWMCFGIGNYFIAISIAPFSVYYFSVICSLFILCWLIGYLLFILPMGLGARELAIVYSFSSLAPLYLLPLVALYSRLGMIIGEFIFLSISYLYYKIKLPKLFQKVNFATILLTIITTVHASYFAYVSILRHNNFLTGRFDLGNMDQTVWNTFHGNFFLLTNPDGVNQISRLGIHADFFLVLIAPLYALWEDPRVLLILQSIVISMGAFFVYAIAIYIFKKVNHLSLFKVKTLALGLSFSYLLNFYIQEQVLFDFHAVSLSTTFLLATSYFFIRKKYALFTLFLFLSVLCKENIYLIGALFGLGLILRKKWSYGVILSGVCLGVFTFLMIKLIPQSRGTEHFALSYLSYLGDKPTKIVANVFLKPYLLFPLVFNFQTLQYYYELFVTTGFLALIAPTYLIFALPDLAINTLSTNQNLRSYQFHYGATIIPFIYVSTIYGIKKILNFKKSKTIQTVLVYYLFAITLITTWNFSNLPGAKNADYFPFVQQKGDIEYINNAINSIPLAAKVSATNNIGAHLSQRESIYVLPRGIDMADYLVFYKENLDLAKSYEANPKYLEVAHREDFWVFKKISSL